jgi:hypothetical protein
MMRADLSCGQERALCIAPRRGLRRFLECAGADRERSSANNKAARLIADAARRVYRAGFCGGVAMVVGLAAARAGGTPCFPRRACVRVAPRRSDQRRQGSPSGPRKADLPTRAGLPSVSSGAIRPCLARAGLQIGVRGATPFLAGAENSHWSDQGYAGGPQRRRRWTGSDPFRSAYPIGW